MLPFETINLRRSFPLRGLVPSSTVLLILFLTALSFYYTLHSGKIASNEGLGMDGAFYGVWTIDYIPTLKNEVEYPEEMNMVSSILTNPECLEKGNCIVEYRDVRLLNEKNIIEGRRHRILIPAIMHETIKFFGVSHSVKNVIQSYIILNVLCMFATCMTIITVIRKFGCDKKLEIIYVIAFFLSSATLKWSSYYPVLLDQPAMLLGALMLLSYINRWRTLLCLLTFISPFVWPIALYFGLALVIFPRPNRQPDISPPPEWKPALLSAILTTGIAVLVGGYAFLCFWSQGSQGLANLMPVSSTTQPIVALLPFSILSTVILYYFALRNLINTKYIYEKHTYINQENIIGLLCAALIYISQALIKLYFFGLDSEKMKIFVVLLHIITTGQVAPFKALFAHILFYGPILAFTVLLWPTVSKKIQEMGPGLVISTILILSQSIESESRHLIHAFPLFFCFTITSIRYRNQNIIFYSTLLLLSIHTSRLLDIKNGILIGPWDGIGGYAAQALMSGILFSAILLLYKDKNTEQDPKK